MQIRAWHFVKLLAILAGVAALVSGVDWITELNRPIPQYDNILSQVMAANTSAAHITEAATSTSVLAVFAVVLNVVANRFKRRVEPKNRP